MTQSDYDRDLPEIYGKDDDPDYIEDMDYVEDLESDKYQDLDINYGNEVKPNN